MITILQAQIAQQMETNRLLSALLERGLQQPPGRDLEAQVTNIQLGNFGNSQNSQGRKQSPKLEFAIQWLRQHPEDTLKPGRDLEAQVTMNGESISYKWWNEAKKQI